MSNMEIGVWIGLAFGGAFGFIFALFIESVRRERETRRMP